MTGVPAEAEGRSIGGYENDFDSAVVVRIGANQREQRCFAGHDPRRPGVVGQPIGFGSDKWIVPMAVIVLVFMAEALNVRLGMANALMIDGRHFPAGFSIHAGDATG